MEEKPQRRVLIPVDESGSTLNAVSWYLGEVARPGDHVILLTVVPFQVHKQTNAWVSSEEDESTPSESSSGEDQQAQQLLAPAADQEARKELIRQARKLKDFFAKQFQEAKERVEKQAPQSAPHNPNSSYCSQEQQSQETEAEDEANRCKSLTWEAYVRQGSNVGVAITEAVVEMKVNFVIMGTRGLGAIRRVIMGSVSDYVVHNSHSTVIIVPHMQA
ncbi:hypothetical protein SprV_0100146800 [Sparganum proliferum]